MIEMLLIILLFIIMLQLFYIIALMDNCQKNLANEKEGEENERED